MGLLCPCRPTPEELANFGEPDFVIYNAGMFPANKYTQVRVLSAHHVPHRHLLPATCGECECVRVLSVYATCAMCLVVQGMPASWALCFNTLPCYCSIQC